MYSYLLPIPIACILIGLYLLIRSERVMWLKIETLVKELDWLREHKITGDFPLRQLDSLPPDGKMMREFWKPVKSYAEELKSLEVLYTDMLIGGNKREHNTLLG